MSGERTTVSKYLSGLRLANLSIVFFTQLIFYNLLFNRVNLDSVNLRFEGIWLYLLTITTTIITFSGYMINDYFDFEIDKSAQKQKFFKTRSSYLVTYFNSAIIGLVLAYIISNHLGQLNLVYIYFFANVLLFLYSSHLKSTFLLGNILVSLFSAGVIIILAIAEQPALIEIQKFHPVEFDKILGLSLFFSGFIFLSTLAREIIKDLEDKLADAIHGVSTIAHKLNQGRSQLLVNFNLSALLIFFLIYLYKINNLKFSLLLLAGIIVITLIIIIMKDVHQAKEQAEFSRISKRLKYLLMSGLIFAILHIWT